MPRKLALCSSTSPDRHPVLPLVLHLVPQPYIIVACLGCGQKKTVAATLKATGGLSCVLSAGISVPEEEVAPLDARQQVLGATGWYDRSCIMAGHAPAARAGRHSSCPIQDELSQAWKWHCFVHEASRMVLLSAGERKGAVRCQTHIIQVAPILQTSEKVSHPVWGSCCFSQPGSGRAPPRPTRPELARPPVQGYNYARNSPNNTKLPPKCDPLSFIGM